MKASVLITTYNQEKVIGQAIEGALAQVTSFDYEIVVAEDCSTDRTRSIICEYRDRFPDRIRPLLREQNLGLMRNFPRAFLECRGDYVACLDGDDYWTGSNKLQRQVDFLDAHPDYSICFHNALMVWDDGSQGPTLHSPPGRRATYHLNELLRHDFITTSAAVVRNHLVRDFPDWYETLPVPDWPFFVLHAMHGKIGYLDEDWTVYRQHPAGMYCRLANEKRMEQNIGIVRTFRDVLGPEYGPLLTDAIHARCLSLALYYRKQGNKSLAREFARMSIREAGTDGRGSFRVAAKVFAYMHVPALFGLMARCRAALRASEAGPTAGTRGVPTHRHGPRA
ncbi:glycosyltransferase [Anaerobaca lacustris]|uniref:Glycosyltransferase n=1 Tax=Anaerobaca lacustris TaxID=3044600 RepID=A0AAW6TQR3_9BACT|nr:glycosyltransferase [Sedimentisphaerales bacterium M17dextr]